MTPIERAARALCASNFEEPDEVVTTIGENPGTPVFAWEHRVDDVRAVLTGIREPTQAMIDRAYNHMEANGNDPRFAWDAMIDAMLEEG